MKCQRCGCSGIIEYDERAQQHICRSCAYEITRDGLRPVVPIARLESDYAHSIGVTSADAHTARNIHLTVADCRHIKHVLQYAHEFNSTAEEWTKELISLLKGAC
jgi:hypothetical protein